MSENVTNNTLKTFPIIPNNHLPQMHLKQSFKKSNSKKMEATYDLIRNKIDDRITVPVPRSTSGTGPFKTKYIECTYLP